MPLIVEDGTGLTNSDSYISEADARLYAVGRYPDSDPFLQNTDLENERLLRLATQELDGQYRLRWLGEQASTTQALEWPRLVQGINEYPQDDLGKAETEIARRLSVDTDVNPDTSKSSVTKEKVDVIETEYAAAMGTTDRFTMHQVTDLISEWISSGNVHKILRA